MSAALDRLSELERAATPGPWEGYSPRPHHSAIRQTGTDDLVASPDVGILDGGIATYLTPSDAALIAAARNALPALLAVARAAEAFVTAWDAETEDGENHGAAERHEALAVALAALDAP